MHNSLPSHVKISLFNALNFSYRIVYSFDDLDKKLYFLLEILIYCTECEIFDILPERVTGAAIVIFFNFFIFATFVGDLM